MIRGRLVGGHGFSRATTPRFDSRPAGRYAVAANPHFSPHTVILSAVASSRSEEATQSKDPYGATNQNTAAGNSDKHVARWGNEPPSPPVILRQRSPWRKPRTPTEGSLHSSARELGRAWLQPCRHDSDFDSSRGRARLHSPHPKSTHLGRPKIGNAAPQ
jgi:hypothetical protein